MGINRIVGVMQMNKITGRLLALVAALAGGAASADTAAAQSAPQASVQPVRNVILVHGAWADGSSWSKLIPLLLAKGYSVTAVQLPLTSLADDAATVKRAIALETGPVLLVGHSYGGAVITQAGDLPNVKGLVYVAAFAPDAGESPGSISAANPPEAFPNIAPDSDGYLWIKQDKFRESFCQDLDDADALVMAVTQKAPLGSTFGDNITAPAWKVKPSWYQISTHDRMINPENQKMMSARMNAKTVSLAASHASLASHPEEIADLIDLAATETGF